MNPMSAVRLSSAVVIVAWITCGCGPSRPTRLSAPALDITAIVAGIMQADVDGDGKLGDRELASVPAFVDARSALDSDGDGALSKAEIESWLTRVRASRIAVTSVATVVRHKGRPVVNAVVKFVPVASMAGVAAAEGVTDATGQAQITVPGSRYPGVNCGVYRVEITGTGSDGRPLPARYNSASTLGAAVGGELPADGMLVFTLDRG